MNELYEQNGPNLKLGALFMKHYVEDREKGILSQIYQQAVEQIQQEALQKGFQRTRILNGHYALKLVFQKRRVHTKCVYAGIITGVR